MIASAYGVTDLSRQVWLTVHRVYAGGGGGKINSAEKITNGTYGLCSSQEH